MYARVPTLPVTTLIGRFAYNLSSRNAYVQHRLSPHGFANGPEAHEKDYPLAVRRPPGLDA